MVGTIYIYFRCIKFRIKFFFFCVSSICKLVLILLFL